MTPISPHARANVTPMLRLSVWASRRRSTCARYVKLLTALREARRWIGDGDLSDYIAREIWTPEYAAVVDMVDAALNSSNDGGVEHG